MHSVKIGLSFVSIFGLIAGADLAQSAETRSDTKTDASAKSTNSAPGLYSPLPERADDPPPSAAAMSRRTSSAGARVTFGRYTSVQVNVDSFGNNIVGDAANEPSMAINPADPNRIAIGWRQFDTVASNFRQAGVAHSVNRGGTWTFSGVLEPGRFRSDPVLASDAFGNFFYSSLSYSLADPDLFVVNVFKSTDGGITWPASVPAFGGDKQWMVADDRSSGTGAGHVYQSWNVQFTCCGFSDFTRSINGGSSYQAPLELPDPRMKWGTLDTDSDGVLYMGGAALDQGGHLFVRSADAKVPGTTPTFDPPVRVNLDGSTGGFGGFSGPNPEGLLGQVWVAAHPSKPGHVYMLSSVVRAADPTDVMFARSLDGGRTWSPPHRVNDDPPFDGAWQWFGTMSVAPNGRIDVTWNDTRNTGDATRSAVFYSYSLDEGTTWSANEQVSPEFNSHLGFPNQAKMGDYAHLISDDGGTNLAYAATFNGEQDVYFLRIQQDCDESGLDDDCDVACGAPGTRCDVSDCGLRGDCNRNRVPDECEPDVDCNSNAERDICDIAANPALDCNSNRTIDSCEDGNDCNRNQVPDVCDVFIHGDCNGNRVPDDCDVAENPSADRNGDQIPDECQGACCDCIGCSDQAEGECRLRGGIFGGLGVLCGDAKSCAPPVFDHDQCALALELPSAPGITVGFDNRCTTGDGPETVPCPTDQPFGTDLWYSYTAPCDGRIHVDTCNETNFDGMLAVYGGGLSCICPMINNSLLECGDDTCGFGGGPAFVEVQVLAGRCYTIRLGGWGDDTGTGELTVGYLGFCNPTDLNGDTVTDLADFAIFQDCFGPVKPACTSADFNLDGRVDLDDYRAFHAVFGS